MGQKEISIQNDIANLSATEPGLRLFRNNVGVYWTGRLIGMDGGVARLAGARRVTCGLAEGSGDLIGWQTITITPEMVGKQVAVFTSIEVKTVGNKPAEHQKRWEKVTAGAGGIAGHATSREQARGIIREFIRRMMCR